MATFFFYKVIAGSMSQPFFASKFLQVLESKSFSEKSTDAIKRVFRVFLASEEKSDRFKELEEAFKKFVKSVSTQPGGSMALRTFLAKGFDTSAWTTFCTKL